MCIYKHINIKVKHAPGNRKNKNRKKKSGPHQMKGFMEMFYRARQPCSRTCLSQENQRTLCSSSTYLSFNIRKF